MSNIIWGFIQSIYGILLHYVWVIPWEACIFSFLFFSFMEVNRGKVDVGEREELGEELGEVGQETVVGMSNVREELKFYNMN